MGYHILRNQYRNSLDQSVTVGIVCSALCHVYNAIVSSFLFIHNRMGKKQFSACFFLLF